MYAVDLRLYPFLLFNFWINDTALLKSSKTSVIVAKTKGGDLNPVSYTHLDVYKRQTVVHSFLLFIIGGPLSVPGIQKRIRW